MLICIGCGKTENEAENGYEFDLCKECFSLTIGPNDIN